MLSKDKDLPSFHDHKLVGKKSHSTFNASTKEVTGTHEMNSTITTPVSIPSELAQIKQKLQEISDIMQSSQGD